MLFAIEKFKNRVAELGKRRYAPVQCVAPFTAMEGTLPKDEWYHEIPETIEGKQFGLFDHFVGYDSYLWLEKDVQVPAHREGFEVVGLFDFGKTGGGYNSGFESLLYLDKKPFQGVDTNHKEVLLGEYEGKSINLTFLLWTGLEGGGGAHRPFYHQCQQAELAYLHKHADELYYFGRAIAGSLELMGKTSEYYQPLIAVMDRALKEIQWDEDDVFYPSIDRAHAVLMEGLSKIEKHTDITAHCVGHTHIDVAWLWRLKHTREKAQRSFSTVLRLMERYDEYVFLQTQPQLYKYIKQDRPDIYAKIKEKVAEGKWEAEGGMWVEGDCNVTSGESLVRQILHGTRFLEQEFGKKCEFLWLPDVFGYSWALPQILKLCEIDTFMTTKISWNQHNTIPDDLFKWRGIDGSEILTYFIDTPENPRDIGGRYSTYNGLIEPFAIMGAWTQFKNKELSTDYLISYGYGDGGGGVTRDMLEMRRALDAVPGIPHVKTSKAGDFFKKAHKAVENTDRYVHTWDGELYMEGHRGTYTSQGYNKKTNRHLENKLAQIEWLSSLAYVLGGEYAQQTLHDCWECVLLHQFHDIIPGSSIQEVYQDSRVNYAKAEADADEAKSIALQKLQVAAADTYTVYSTNSYGGAELVQIPETRQGRFRNAAGEELPAQKTADGYAVLVDVQPFACVSVRFEEAAAAAPASSFVLDGSTLQTPFYTITWNQNGQLTEIFDKQENRHVLRPGQLGNILEIYEDKPRAHDAWDIDIFYTEKMEQIPTLGAPEVVENGLLRTVLRFSYNYRNSRIEQDMILYRDSKRIDFKTWIDWHEDHKLLKTAFCVDVRSTRATYDIQFGHVERPTHWSNSWDLAKFEVCGQKWADLSENSYGVSILNDCKYGHNIKDNVLRLTLLKSAKYPDHTADMGEHTFTYSLYPHSGSVTAGGTIEEANRLNLPAQVICGTVADSRRLVCLDSNHVQLDVIKKAEDEDCLIVRMHECRGDRGEVSFCSEFDVKRIVPCNLLEHDVDEAVEGNRICFSIKPFEIKTFKLYF